MPITELQKSAQPLSSPAPSRRDGAGSESGSGLTIYRKKQDAAGSAVGAPQRQETGTWARMSDTASEIVLTECGPSVFKKGSDIPAGDRTRFGETLMNDALDDDDDDIPPPPPIDHEDDDIPPPPPLDAAAEAEHANAPPQTAEGRAAAALEKYIARHDELAHQQAVAWPKKNPPRCFEDQTPRRYAAPAFVGRASPAVTGAPPAVGGGASSPAAQAALSSPAATSTPAPGKIFAPSPDTSSKATDAETTPPSTATPVRPTAAPESAPARASAVAPRPPTFMTPMKPPLDAKPTDRWGAQAEIDKHYRAATDRLSDADQKLLMADGDYRLSLYAKVMLERAGVAPESYLDAYKKVFDPDSMMTREGMALFYALINRGKTVDDAMEYINNFNLPAQYVVQGSGSGRPQNSPDWSPLAKGPTPVTAMLSIDAPWAPAPASASSIATQPRRNINAKTYIDASDALNRQYDAKIKSLLGPNSSLPDDRETNYRISFYSKCMLELTEISEDAFLKISSEVFESPDIALTQPGLACFYSYINIGHSVEEAMKEVRGDALISPELYAIRSPNAPDWSPLAKRMSAPSPETSKPPAGASSEYSIPVSSSRRAGITENDEKYPVSEDEGPDGVAATVGVP
jgi:hypothetical protein